MVSTMITRVLQELPLPVSVYRTAPGKTLLQAADMAFRQFMGGNDPVVAPGQFLKGMCQDLLILFPGTARYNDCRILSENFSSAAWENAVSAPVQHPVETGIPGNAYILIPYCSQQVLGILPSAQIYG